MSKIKETMSSWFRRRKPKPVTREEAADISDWVNEGGSFDPQGPPPVRKSE
ncbi:MAG TPA: hypothetical protein PLA13_01285 [Microbacteriaceae bacterium]|jgi:hypothetical protein|nr:hypothetical protein [Microbacteriaceae bacterium]HQX34967.1 hypothetical protein [Microbacteriaceae bacterium]HQZ47875.1 hypothetical protein [Microbacteriaceae bacterium]HRA08910.1 hypothetical protein [Microbacteriaceae bacterium]